MFLEFITRGGVNRIIKDTSTKDPMIVLERKWSDLPTGNQMIRIDTKYYLYAGYIYKYSSDYGMAIVIGYGSIDTDNNYCSYRRLYNGTWRNTVSLI